MKNVLVVEDDVSLNNSLSEELKSAGFYVLSAFNGQEGLNLATQNQIDLILLDIVMPGLDGIEMVYQLRSQLSIPPPIYILTNLEKTSLPNNIDRVFLKADTDLETIVAAVKDKLL